MTFISFGEVWKKVLNLLEGYICQTILGIEGHIIFLLLKHGLAKSLLWLKKSQPNKG